MNADGRKILKEASQYRVGLLGDIILRNALFHGDRVAFVYGDERITFKSYNERVNRLIHALTDMGVKKGDVLGVLSWNCAEYMDIFGAAEKGGFIIAPINVRLSADELEYLINDSESTVLFVGQELADMAETLKSRIPKVKHFISLEGSSPGMVSEAELVEKYPTDEPDVSVDDHDPLLICYTSGTTGRPRGALYTHEGLREDVICHSLEIPITLADRGISLMPLFHIGGIAIRAYFFYQAVPNVIMKIFDPKGFLEIVEKEKVTNVIVVPTHLAVVLDLPEFSEYDVSSITRLYYAGSPMPTALLKRGMEIFGSVFFQGYGQTESGPEISFLKEKDHEVLDKSPEEQEKLLSTGFPALGVQVRIVDKDDADVAPGEVGEIIVKSRQIMKEYWNKPAETAETIVDGWLHTGDMGRYDDGGYIYIVDRKKDMIITGGENVYPRDVEEVLHKHPAVLECGVFGIPHPKWVEAVHAMVTLKQGASATPEELIAFCKERIAGYKAPKTLEIADELPKSATGKILKKEMRKKYRG